VKNELFADNELGIDLIAINLQRARDHGLPGYVHYRKLCGVGEAKSFKDLESNIRPEVMGSFFLLAYNNAYLLVSFR
jgi:hypothetical protein